MKRAVVVACVLIGGCGSDGNDGPVDGPPLLLDCNCLRYDAPENVCGDDGAGTATGSVQGVSVTPVVRVNKVSLAGVTGIVLDEVPGACGEPATSGEHLILLVCGEPEPGTYPIVDEQTFACPGTNAAVLVEEGGGADVAAATGGWLQITGTVGCTTGSYSAEFGGGTSTIGGSFAAISCP
jgi:hypothetical protein